MITLYVYTSLLNNLSKKEKFWVIYPSTIPKFSNINSFSTLKQSRSPFIVGNNSNSFDSKSGSGYKEKAAKSSKANLAAATGKGSKKAEMVSEKQQQPQTRTGTISFSSFLFSGFFFCL